MKKHLNNFRIIAKNQIKKLCFVFFVMIISVFLDVLSISSLLPIFNELTNTSQPGISSQYFDKLISFFNFEYDIVLFFDFYINFICS